VTLIREAQVVGHQHRWTTLFQKASRGLEPDVPVIGPGRHAHGSVKDATQVKLADPTDRAELVQGHGPIQVGAQVPDGPGDGGMEGLRWWQRSRLDADRAASLTEMSPPRLCGDAGKQQGLSRRRLDERGRDHPSPGPRPEVHSMESRAGPSLGESMDEARAQDVGAPRVDDLSPLGAFDDERTLVDEPDLDAVVEVQFFRGNALETLDLGVFPAVFDEFDAHDRFATPSPTGRASRGFRKSRPGTSSGVSKPQQGVSLRIRRRILRGLWRSRPSEKHPLVLGRLPFYVHHHEGVGPLRALLGRGWASTSSG
jgi:hypothetical protein